MCQMVVSWGLSSTVIGLIGLLQILLEQPLATGQQRHGSGHLQHHNYSQQQLL
jgi:hypothetical protein